MKYLTPKDAISARYYVATDSNGEIYTIWHGIKVRATTTNAHISKMRIEDKIAVIELDDYLPYSLSKRFYHVS